jgi:hypothetical protein
MDNVINMNNQGANTKQPTVWPEGDIVQDLNWNFYLREKAEDKEKIWISPMMEKAGIISSLRLMAMLYNLDTQTNHICQKPVDTMHSVPFFALITEQVDKELEQDREGCINRYIESIDKTVKPELLKMTYSHTGTMLDENYDKFELQVSPISPGLMIDSPVGSYILEQLTVEEKKEIIPKLPYHIWTGYLVVKAFTELNAFESANMQEQQEKAEKIIKYVMENLHNTDMDFILSVLP